MEDPQNDYESVRWESNEQEQDPQQQEEGGETTLPQRSKSNAKVRRQDSHRGTQPDHNADQVDLAGITNEGFLVCVVDKPQKENEGTKDVYVSYLITTHSDFKTFAKDTFSVRRRFTDFRYLYKSLCNQYPHVAVPPLPDKHNFEYIRGDRFGPDFTFRRGHSLNRFIKRIALHSVLRRNATFLNFLETPDWNAVMRGNSRDRGSSFGDPNSTMGSLSTSTSNNSAIDRFQDWSINFLKAPHKADKRFIAVREKADKFDEDLANVEKGVAKVVRREGDLETDYADLAQQMQKLVALEPGVGSALTSFAASVETTSQALRDLKLATDRDYMESLRDMASYTSSMKTLLKTRDQKQLDFEALTEYLQKATTDRDILASERGPPSLTSSPANFVRSKIEDVRGVDHEQSRRDRLRKSEMKIEDLNRAVDEAKNTSEAFDEQVIKESAEFERIKSVEFRDTLGGLASAEMDFWKELIGTWEELIKDIETGERTAR